MKILGICGSNRPAGKSGTYTLVERILKSTGFEYDLISFFGKKINGCTGCLGCACDNICKINDGMTPLRDMIESADAYVIGSPNYYSGMNAATHAFLERLFQFRHQKGDALWGKLAVAVGVGGISGLPVIAEIERFMMYNFIETVAKVTGQGRASCFSCGFGETCEVGIPCMMFGEGVKITEDIIPDVMKQPELLKEAEEAGELMAKRLKNHNRNLVAAEMQLLLGKKFAESV